jgi:hypothetical protein
MSKGGGSSKSQQQTVVSQPWDKAQPYLSDIFGKAQNLSNQPASYYPDSTVVGPTQAEGQAWAGRNAYDQSVFGGATPLNYGALSGAINTQLGGGSTLGGMANTLAPQATNALTSGFRAPDTAGISGIRTPGMSNAASNIGTYGFGTTLDANGNAPTFGVAGGLDARGAYAKALEGTPDYAGVQGAIDAANAPILRQFNQQILPQLNQQATFTNNSTGGTKALNRVLPDIGERMANNAQTITNNERLRALDSQQQAANAVTQGGYQGYGLGLQTAQGQRGLEQNLANLGLTTGQSRGQLQLADQGANLANSQFGLQQQGMVQDASDRYRSDLLSYGSLAGQLGTSAGNQQLQAAGLFPTANQVGQTPTNDALTYANYDRALKEDQLGSQVDKFNYLRDQPYNNLNWYGGLVNGTASPYGTQTQTGPAQSRASGALGGALVGYQLANQIGGGNTWANLLGTGLGSYLGGWG